MLKYVPAAVGETDVPDTVPEWISQRRRCVALESSSKSSLSFDAQMAQWQVRGFCSLPVKIAAHHIYSFFAAIYSLTHVFQLLGTSHSVWRKIALFLESFYNFLQLAFAWFGMGNFYVRLPSRFSACSR